jgi:hypothetical protein
MLSKHRNEKIGGIKNQKERIGLHEKKPNGKIGSHEKTEKKG